MEKLQEKIQQLVNLPDNEFIDLSSLSHIVKQMMFRINQQDKEIEYLQNRVEHLDRLVQY